MRVGPLDGRDDVEPSEVFAIQDVYYFGTNHLADDGTCHITINPAYDL